MKYKFLWSIVIITIIFGCGTKSQIKDSLKAHSRSNRYTTVAILSDNPEGNEFANCVQEKLESDFKYFKFIQGDKFREALFPWLEPNTTPKNIEELSTLLTKPLVKKQIESFGVELLIYMHGYTKEYDTSVHNFLAVGGSSTRKTDIQTTLWDLKEIVHVGDLDISFEGIVGGGITIIPPFVYIIPAFTETKACNETANRISNCLIGKDSSKDK